MNIEKKENNRNFHEAGLILLFARRKKSTLFEMYECGVGKHIWSPFQIRKPTLVGF